MASILSVQAKYYGKGNSCGGSLNVLHCLNHSRLVSCTSLNKVRLPASWCILRYVQIRLMCAGGSRICHGLDIWENGGEDLEQRWLSYIISSLHCCEISRCQSQYNNHRFRIPDWHHVYSELHVGFALRCPLYWKESTGSVMPAKL